MQYSYVARASEWPYSSIHRAIRHGLLTRDWAGGVAGDLSAGER